MKTINKLFLIISMIFLTLNFLDFLSTAVGMMSGRAVESNQFINWMGGPFSPAGLIFKFVIFPLIILLPIFFIINKYKDSGPAVAIIGTASGTLGITLISNLRYVFYEFLNDHLLRKLDDLDARKEKKREIKRKKKEFLALISTYIIWYGFIYCPLWAIINFFAIGMTVTQVTVAGILGIVLGLVNPQGFIKTQKVIRKKLRCN